MNPGSGQESRNEVVQLGRLAAVGHEQDVAGAESVHPVLRGAVPAIAVVARAGPSALDELLGERVQEVVGNAETFQPGEGQCDVEVGAAEQRRRESGTGRLAVGRLAMPLALTESDLIEPRADLGPRGCLILHAEQDVSRIREGVAICVQHIPLYLAFIDHGSSSQAASSRVWDGWTSVP